MNLSRLKVELEKFWIYPGSEFASLEDAYKVLSKFQTTHPLYKPVYDFEVEYSFLKQDFEKMLKQTEKEATFTLEKLWE